MSKKSVLITGANRGIGLEFARQYLREGWRVIGTTRASSNRDEILKLKPKNGGELAVHQLDVTKTNSIESTFRNVKADDDELDLLINNAGMSGSDSSINNLNEEELLEVFNTNCVGSFRVTRIFLPLLKKTQGIVAMITSLMGSIDDNRSGGHYSYRVSKAALNMLGKSLSVDLEEDGISVLLLHPGWVKTRMGGQNAKISVEKSVSGLRTVINEIGKNQTGRFVNYNGEALPW